MYSKLSSLLLLPQKVFIEAISKLESLLYIFGGTGLWHGSSNVV